jgi:hypothetical protein
LVHVDPEKGGVGLDGKLSARKASGSSGEVVGEGEDGSGYPLIAEVFGEGALGPEVFGAPVVGDEDDRGGSGRVSGHEDVKRDLVVGGIGAGVGAGKGFEILDFLVVGIDLLPGGESDGRRWREDGRAVYGRQGRLRNLGKREGGE